MKVKYKVTGVQGNFNLTIWSEEKISYGGRELTLKLADHPSAINSFLEGNAKEISPVSYSTCHEARIQEPIFDAVYYGLLLYQKSGEQAKKRADQEPRRQSLLRQLQELEKALRRELKIPKDA